jgi:hypothetical protein
MKKTAHLNMSRTRRASADISDHVYEAEPHDWYVEEEWCVDLLFNAVDFVGAVHDPCCGRGTILKVAQSRGFAVSGSDLVERRHVVQFDFTISDFDADGGWAGPVSNIVFNPPFSYKRGIAARMIERALDVSENRVAALVPIKFLASQGRHELFTTTPLEQVLILSTRPSMPPGRLLESGKVEPDGGKVDYCWMVWNNHARSGDRSIDFLLK